MRAEWREEALRRTQKAAFIDRLKAVGVGSQQAQKKLLHDSTEKAKVEAQFAADMDAYAAAKAEWNQAMLAFNGNGVSPE